MICYKDMTFCVAMECINYKCPRKMTEQVAEGAQKWWGSNDAPMAIQDFSATCPDYITK